MTGRDDNPLARWSRRKLAARKAEIAPADEERPADAKQELRSDVNETGAESDANEPMEPLPRIEDLTIESDLTAFLRDGVPAPLRNTALRKMWSLDPVIRDYVGPAEYAWDFNKPGSMPGFGPLEVGKSVANFLSTVSRFEPQDSATKPQSAPQDSVASSTEEESDLPHDPAALPNAPADASAPAEPARPTDPPETRQSVSAHSQVADAKAADKPSPAGSPRSSARSRHGGALPR